MLIHERRHSSKRATSRKTHREYQMKPPLLLPLNIKMDFFCTGLIYRCVVYLNMQNKSVSLALMCSLMHISTCKSVPRHRMRIQSSGIMKHAPYYLASGTSLRLILLLSTPYLWIGLSYLGFMVVEDCAAFVELKHYINICLPRAESRSG